MNATKRTSTKRHASQQRATTLLPAPIRDPHMLALSIRQPFAELVMCAVKAIEYRSRPTRVRGRIYVYASLGRLSRDLEVELAEECREEYELAHPHAGTLDLAAIDALPRGFIVGTVELFDCDGEEWHLRAPERFAEPIKPDRHPQPVWFHPFS